jgi:hypothetical protein
MEPSEKPSKNIAKNIDESQLQNKSKEELLDYVK